MLASTDSRWALAFSSAARLLLDRGARVQQLARHGLNDCVSVPSSSLVATIGRGRRSPSATARVPSASSSSGCARLPAMTKAVADRAEAGQQQRQVSAPI
jgi:hypothetical protein